MRSIKISAVCFGLMAIVSCQKEQESEISETFFSNPSAEETGLDFTNQLTENRDANILDYLYFYNGGGVSIGDINNDGLADIYLTGNQVKNKLFLNKGNFEFEDVTEEAGVAGESSWNTGCTMADVNGDGLLDIYVSAVVGVNGFRGHNELFINNGDLTFTEMSAKYGLNEESFSSQAAFFDFDNDGDLDVYILNHAVHTNESFGPSSIREKRVYESGDKLMRNDGGKFTDISEEAGIFGGANSYGLGLTTADFNNDGFTDIYVGNDFHEDDYFYINNGDGTFSESLKDQFGHISRFSMGNDAADINNDGYVDLMTLDMLAEDETVLKASAGDDSYNVHELKTGKLGYQPQYTRNMLQMNNHGQFFTETALMSGVAATDWSWGPLFADYDQDGKIDLFITNGIPKRPNDLDYVKFISNEQIQKKLDQTTLVDNQALDLMPEGRVTNYFFRGKGNGMFEDDTKNWIKNDSIISTGVAYGDLDNDGDLDIVTNNVNSPVSIYRNDQADGNYLQVSFRNDSGNTFGIGSTAVLFTSEGTQIRQLYATRSYQSASQPILHFGIPKDVKIDSLHLEWPGGKSLTLKNVKPNQLLQVHYKDFIQDTDFKNFKYNDQNQLFKLLTNDFGLNYEHQENDFSDFDMQKLIPHKFSDLGPAVTVADINNDGLEDVFFGASRFQPAQIFIQGTDGFHAKSYESIAEDSLAEDVSATAGDFNNDGKIDILVASGGGESVGANNWLLDRLYLGTENGFVKDTLFPETFANSSIVKSADFDKDGDLDVFIGANSVNYDFGNMPKSALLLNENGQFTKLQHAEFENIGMVNDASWTDFDQDGNLDLILVGEWMSPRFFRNNSGKFEEVTPDLISEKLNGMWQSIQPFDADGDGDEDYLLGNWGLNTKLKADEKTPLRMYYSDFDGNGLTETLIATEKDDKYYFIGGLDDLSAQLSTLLRKRFTSYQKFAGKAVNEIFTPEELNDATLFEIHTLASGYLENRDGKFVFHAFPSQVQVAPIRSMLRYDFDHDGNEEVLFAGNYFGVTPYHGKFDGLGGLLYFNKNKILNSVEIGLNLSQNSVKNLSVIEIGKKPYLLVTSNNSKVLVYEITSVNE
ncbi:MAG: VCBS repeat-containing protein [Christiangramia sp.]